MRRFIIVAVMLAALAFPAGAAADTFGEPPPAGDLNGMTVEITAVNLIAKVEVEVEVDVSCEPLPSGEGISASWEETFFRLWVKQASGRAVAAGYVDGGLLNGEDLCDGQAHSIVMTTSADPAGVPFKKGTAAVALAVYAGYSWYDENTYEGGWGSRSASTGWFATRLGR